MSFALQLWKKHGKTSVRVRKTSIRVRKTSVRVRKTSVGVGITLRNSCSGDFATLEMVPGTST
jgi:hypothetical protein